MQTKLLKKAGKTKEQIDRLELKDDVLIRQNGNPTYFAADIAYHRNKLVDRGFDKAIDVWGADHHGHVARLKGALEAIGIDSSRLDVVLMQLVNLMKDGEPVRMSKRTGNAVTLVDLLDEVPIDAARFFLQYARARLNNRLRFGTCRKRGFAKPRLLLPVRKRENMQHTPQDERGGH